MVQHGGEVHSYGGSVQDGKTGFGPDLQPISTDPMTLPMEYYISK